MKISELIERLEDFKEQFGDLEIHHLTDEEGLHPSTKKIVDVIPHEIRWWNENYGLCKQKIAALK